MTDIQRHIDKTTEALHERLRRHKLIFVQAGAVFEGLDMRVLEATRAVLIDAQALTAHEEAPQVIVTGLEALADSPPGSASLGELRQIVSDLLGRGVEVCLWSSAPRIAYVPMPGSSLIDDASQFFMQLLPELEGDPESVYPAVRISSVAVEDMFARAITELGMSVLASLDRAIFDGQMDHETMFGLLDPRESEALRGAGLAFCEDRARYEFASPRRFNEFRSQLANVLASEVHPQGELSEISQDLWLIERTLRRAVRSAAVDAFGQTWRGQVLHGDLNAKVLTRAMVDGAVAVKSVRELRDPIEWLSLGELLEVITSTTFNGLDLQPLVWTKFGQDVLPIRNRLSHMRHFKHGDRGTVKMWVSQVERLLPA